jgi:putative ABC transport system permease protein
MLWLAWKMLTGDRAKFLGIVFGVAFGTVLIAQQASIFIGLMRRTSSQIIDITSADIWVMDKRQQNVDEIRPMPENRLYQVRGVDGVEWAVRLFKGGVRARTSTGHFRQSILVGIDDASLTGAPRDMKLGSAEDLRRPDGVIVDEDGYRVLFPGEPIELGRTLDMNAARLWSAPAKARRRSKPFQLSTPVTAKRCITSRASGTRCRSYWSRPKRAKRSPNYANAFRSRPICWRCRGSIS